MRPAGPSPPAPPAGPPGAGEGAWHPPAEALAAHLRGALPEPEADQLREHVTGCGECIELLLDLDAFEQPAGEPEDAGRGADGNTETLRAESWRRLLAQRPWDEPGGLTEESDAEEIAAEEIAARAPALRPPAPLPPAPGRTAPPPRRGRWHEGRRRLLGTGLIAAALAAAVVAGSWSLHLVGRLAAPDPDHPIVDLVPGGGVTRGGGDGDAFAVPPRASFTVVIIPDIDVGQAFDRYDAEILDSAGRTVWRGTLRPADPTSPFLTLGLSRRLLSEPSYTLRLWGVDGGRRTEAGVYPFELTP
jgi:hypothetical protein